MCCKIRALAGWRSRRGTAVAWHVKLVLFTHKAFTDGTINTRVKTLDQINYVVSQSEAVIADTPIAFNCSRTSERTYGLGQPIVIPYA
jgi:hypothetical protein